MKVTCLTALQSALQPAGPLMVGVKMTGNQHVPAGKKTFMINTTDNLSVRHRVKEGTDVT
jgi:hypothetical protein